MRLERLAVHRVINQGKKKTKRGHVGIEPTTSPTLKENHTTRPMALKNIPGGT